MRDVIAKTAGELALPIGTSRDEQEPSGQRDAQAVGHEMSHETGEQVEFHRRQLVVNEVPPNVREKSSEGNLAQSDQGAATERSGSDSEISLGTSTAAQADEDPDYDDYARLLHMGSPPAEGTDSAQSSTKEMWDAVAAYIRRKAANVPPANDIVALIRCSGGPQPKFFDRLAALAQEYSVDVQIVKSPEFVNEIVHQHVIDMLDWIQKLNSRTVNNFQRRMIAYKKGH